MAIETVAEMRQFASFYPRTQFFDRVNRWADVLESAERRIAELEARDLEWQAACCAYAEQLAALREKAEAKE